MSASRSFETAQRLDDRARRGPRRIEQIARVDEQIGLPLDRDGNGGVPGVVDVALALIQVANRVDLAAEVLIAEVRVGDVDDPHCMYAGSRDSCWRRTFIAGRHLEPAGERVQVDLHGGGFAPYRGSGISSCAANMFASRSSLRPTPTPISSARQYLGSTRPSVY